MGKNAVFFFNSLPKQNQMNTEIFNHVNWLAVLVARSRLFLFGRHLVHNIIWQKMAIV